MLKADIEAKANRKKNRCGNGGAFIGMKRIYGNLRSRAPQTGGEWISKTAWT